MQGGVDASEPPVKAKATKRKADRDRPAEEVAAPRSFIDVYVAWFVDGFADELEALRQVLSHSRKHH